jgi:hypothetical protein
LEYYFPYEESYIAYVYKKEKKYVLVVAYRSTVVKFRLCLLDAKPNIKELFTHKNKPLSHPQLWANLREIGTLSPTLSPKEYKEALFAKQSKLKHYSLFEAKEYDGFIKTLSNIFINNRVDSQAIKKVIVSSLNVEKEIDIEQLKRYLSEFNTTYEDIAAYEKSTKQIEKLLRHLEKYELLSMQLQERLSTLLCSKEDALATITQKQQQNQALKESAEALEEEIKKIQEIFERKNTKLTEKIGSLKEKIRVAKEKEAYYKQENIEQKQHEFMELATLQEELLVISSQKEFLTKAYEELRVSHENSITTIQNNYTAQHNRALEEKNRSLMELSEKKESLKEQ